MTLRLDALTAEQCEQARQWRNLTPEVWRTPFLLTQVQQADFYRDVVSGRNYPGRYWAVLEEECYWGAAEFVGMVGLIPISFENGWGEISIVVRPEKRHTGLGRQVVRLLLQEAFERLRLETVVAEVYESNETALAFWRSIADEYAAHTTRLPRRKFWHGKLWASLLVTIAREDYETVVKLPAGQTEVSRGL